MSVPVTSSGSKNWLESYLNTRDDFPTELAPMTSIFKAIGGGVGVEVDMIDLISPTNLCWSSVQVSGES